MALKLTNKLLVILSFCCLLFIVGFSIVFSILFTQHAQNVDRAQVQTRLLNLADTISKTTRTEDITRTFNQRIMSTTNLLSNDEVWLIDKRTLKITGAHTHPKLTYDQLTPESAKQIQHIFEGKTIDTSSFNLFSPQSQLTAGVPVYDKSGQISGALLMHYTLPSWWHSWYDGVGIIALTSFIMYIILLILLRIWLNRLLIPLATFNRYIDKLIAHDYKVHLKTKNSTELGKLANKLNQLTLYLKTTEQAQREELLGNRNLLLTTGYRLYATLKLTTQLLQELTQLYARTMPKELANRLAKLPPQLENEVKLLFQPDTSEIFSLEHKLLNVMDSLRAACAKRKLIALSQDCELIIESRLEKNIMLIHADEQRLTQMFIEIIDYLLSIHVDKENITLEIQEDSNRYLIAIYQPTMPTLNGTFPLPVLIAQHLAGLQTIELRYEQSDEQARFRFIIPKF